MLPFSLIYLHNVRGIALGTAGLILATNGVVSIVAAPVTGMLVDRLGGKLVLGGALVFLAVGYSGYALVEVPVARVRGRHDHRDRERRLLAGAVDADRGAHPGREANPGVRHAARRDEPRDRDRRARRWSRRHRRRPTLVRAAVRRQRVDVPRLPRGSDRLRSRTDARERTDAARRGRVRGGDPRPRLRRRDRPQHRLHLRRLRRVRPATRLLEERGRCR